MCVRRLSKKNVRGFTLVELIVAITILALVAVLGWRGLDGIVRSRVALTAEMEQTRDMQLTFAQLQSDCAQLAPASEMRGRPTLSASQDRLLMVRLVFADQQPTRVQIVDYRLRNGVLTRRESIATRDLNVIDAMWETARNNVDGDTANGQVVVLQSNIGKMQIQLWGSDNQGWRPPAAIDAADNKKDNNPSTNQWSGLRVALQASDRDGIMIKTFLLGAV